ncbi:SIS domain-containing protein [Ferruginibacter sp.]|uniref:KpsF/GutQ family sugar-phosphate isomerase n=1 Tax=Ferruginibacter sp. TaxID=1940288 RepID=UPI00374CD6BA
MSNKDIITTAKSTIQLEADAIKKLLDFIDGNFEKAVDTIAFSKGRLVVSGIGKSAIIAQKIVATFNSTGTPALFMHAADAIHGDLGMIQKEDIIIIISKSGDSPEIKVLATLIKNFGNTLIGMVGNTASFLASQCDIMLNTTVDQEACPNNLAPTTSTTAQMVMGDALAVCLMEVKGFGTIDFARFHPGGMLGKKLYLRVMDLSSQNEHPAVFPNATINQVIVEMTRKRLGTTAVVNNDNTVAGIITDGDLRRMLEKTTVFSALQAQDIMSSRPETINAAMLAADALEIMKSKNISQLIVIENGFYAGIIHLHDLIKEGIV